MYIYSNIFILIIDIIRDDEVSTFIKDTAIFTYLAEKLFAIQDKVMMPISIKLSYFSKVILKNEVDVNINHKAQLLNTASASRAFSLRNPLTVLIQLDTSTKLYGLLLRALFINNLIPNFVFQALVKQKATINSVRSRLRAVVELYFQF